MRYQSVIHAVRENDFKGIRGSVIENSSRFHVWVYGWGGFSNPGIWEMQNYLWGDL